MLLFQFRDPLPIEAYVLAPDFDRARELFQRHLQVHGGDPDTLLYRELVLEHLGEDDGAAVSEAMGLNRQGLLVRDDIRGWVFVTPLGNEARTQQD